MDITDFLCTSPAHADADGTHATVSIEGNLLCDQHANKLLASLLREIANDASTPHMHELMQQAASQLEKTARQG